MFYNNYRSTRAAQKQEEIRKLTGKNIINPKERLMNLNKRQKLRDLLIQKFSEKYKINYPEQIIENEISKFVQKEKLNDVDLQRLDNKIGRMLRNNSAKNILKSNLTKNLQQPKNKEEEQEEANLLNREENPVENQDNINLNNTLNQNNKDILLPQVNTLNQNLNQNNENRTMVHSQSSNNLNQNKTFTLFPRRKFYNRQIYKKPEEELAELEEELKKDEEEYKPRGPRLDFTKEGDEWNAINKYNKKLFDQQIREERMKDNEMKRRTKEDLDNQIKQKIKKEYEDELKEKEYDKILQEHLKKIDEIERKKAEEIKKQIMREKINRDALLKEEHIRKRIADLKEKNSKKN